jgi:hypothetical protein
MTRMTLVIVIVSVALGTLTIGGTATAAEDQTTWDQAAAQLKFPVYEPKRTLGLKPSWLQVNPCPTSLPPKQSVSAAYGNPATPRGPHFSITESHFLSCGNGDEAKAVRSVIVNGVKTQVHVVCGSRRLRCDVTVNHGFKNGFQLIFRKPGKKKRTFIDFYARNISLADFLKIARSLTRVTLKRETVHLNSFLSPDRKVWCRIVAKDAWCGTHTPSSLAKVRRDGTLTSCRQSPMDICLQNWDTKAPVLRDGQRSELNGFSCSSTTATIICTVTAGAGRGRGFSINATEILPVGP